MRLGRVWRYGHETRGAGGLGMRLGGLEVLV